MRLTKPIGYIIAFAVLGGVLLVLSAGPRRDAASGPNTGVTPFRIEKVVSQPIVSFRPLIASDIDHDGNDDFFVNKDDRLLRYRLQGNELTLAGERVYGGVGSTRVVADVDGDGRQEFLVLRNVREAPYLFCYRWFSPNEASAPIYTIGPLLPPRKGALQDPLLCFSNITVRSLKADGDPRATILIQLNMPKDEAPCRSLLAYDGATGRDLWRFDCGAYLLNMKCEDFGAGVPRVLLATGGLTSGIVCHGHVDSLSQLFCLDRRDGRCLWSMEMSGYAGRCDFAIADIDHDGLKEILATRYAEMGDSTFINSTNPWNVAILNHEGKMLSTFLLSSRVCEIHAVHLDRDSIPEILIEGVGRSLSLFSHDFKTRRELVSFKQVGGSGFRFYGASDFAGDGKERLLGYMAGRFIALDQRGNIIADHPIKNILDVQRASHGGRDYFVFRTGSSVRSKEHSRHAVGDSIHVMAMSRTPIADRLRAHSRRLTIGASAAVLLGGWAVISVRRRLRRRHEQQIDFQEAQNELLTAMSAFGHGGSSLKTLDRLRLHLKNWERIRSDGVTREDLFARLQQTYRETIVPELEHLVMLARRANVPEGVWETLLSQARLAGDGIGEVLAFDSEKAAPWEEKIAKTLSALDAVDESIAGIRSHLRSVFSVPVAENLDRLIAQFRYDHGTGGISFALAPDASGGAAVFISSVSFDKIFETLLTNAVRATEGKPDAEIAIAAQWEGNYCRIDVRDNGCGIPREDWERVFDRHYTTKAEGGFGLYYSRQELARFGGKIYVVDSVLGSGTTMRAILRKSEKAGTS